MSKTKHVEYRDSWFWAYDVALSIFLKHHIDVAVPHAATPGNEWLTEAISWWRVVAAVPDYGLGVDPAWSTAQIDVFIQLADQACNLLADRDYITADEISAWQVLDDLTIHTRGATEVSTAPVVELGRAIIALVQGTAPAPPVEKTWVYGTPEGRTAI
ncbi:MAG TPA: hypothetical protein VG324_13115 [Blastocatellia bacterium]|nr:hypothetical protein [Blastocatellia bacterium]